MARPTKQGIDYFPLDCTPDHNLEMFIAETGAEGFGILIMIWQRIYRSEGYYILNDDDLLLILKRDSLSTFETVKATLETAIKRGLFSRELHDKYGILTSTGIQKRYFQAARLKKQANIYEDFCLIDVSNIDNVVINVVNPVINVGNATNVKVDVNVDVDEDVNESVVVRKKRTPQPKFNPPEKRETADFFLEHDSTVEEAGKFWHHFNASGWMLGNGRKMKSWQSAAHKWILNSKTTYRNGTYQRRNGTLADQQPLDEAGAVRLIESIANDPRYE